MYTPTGDEKCPESGPAVYMLTQCTPLLVIEDEPAVYTLVHYTPLFVMRGAFLRALSMYTPIGDEIYPKGKPAVKHAIHCTPLWVEKLGVTPDYDPMIPESPCARRQARLHTRELPWLQNL